MSTRATIKIEGIDFAKVYKHWDGYPDATLAWLEDFNKTFNENRGDDATYKMAQLLRSSAWDAGKYNLDDSQFTGWGVYPINADLGEEYEYTLHTDGTVSYKELY